MSKFTTEWVKRHARITTLLAVSGAVLTGCYSPNGPIPEAPYPAVTPDVSPAQVASTVVRTRERFRHEIPVSGDMPEACQWLQYNHFRPSAQQDVSPAAADAVIVLMPGMLSGANALSYLAEQLVYEGVAQQRHIAVIAVERRNQCLNDLDGFNVAEAARDVQQAVDYYYHGGELQGKQFAGFYRSRDLAFLAEFGLARVVEDFHTVAEHVLPSQDDRRQKLFVGGHSLGGNITSAYMGWDFDGNRATTEDAGYANAAGFIRLDIGITPREAARDDLLTYGVGQQQADSSDDANEAYQRDVAKLRNGRTARVVRMPGVDAESLALLELVAMQAHWEPSRESRLVHEIPMGATPRALLRLIHSESLSRFVTNSPDFFDFRYTNEALLGLILDNDFMPITILQTGLGFLGGGEMAEKRFPNSPAITQTAALLDEFLGRLITDDTQFIARNAGPSLDQLGQGPLYHWVSFDRIGRETDPDFRSEDGQVVFTQKHREMSDIQTVARIVYEGELSFTEWYMPARLGMDLSMLTQPRLIEGLPFYHAQSRRDVPLLEIVATESIVDVNEEPLGELVIADGYQHIDILTAANDRSDYQENYVIAPILQFVNTVQGR